MTTARIDGGAIGSVAELHAALKHALNLPAHTAANLDALWDVLSRDLAGPVALVVADAPALRRRLGAPGARLLDLLGEVAAERADFTLVLE